MTSTPQEDKVPERGEETVDVTSIVQQLEDLVKFTLECEEKELKPDISFVEVHKKLMQIQKDIELFQSNYRAHLSMFNLTPENVKPTPEELESLDPKQKKIFDRMRALQTSCETARERIYQSMQQDQETLKAVKNELRDKDKDKIHRKGKFKGMGGKKGWLPT